MSAETEKRVVALARQICEPTHVFLNRLIYWKRKHGLESRNDLDEYLAAHHGFTLAARLDLEPNFDVAALLEEDWKKAQQEWTTADTISRWARAFRCSPAAMSRRLKDGTIPNKKLSSKMYQIAVEALPADHRDRFRAARK